MADFIHIKSVAELNEFLKIAKPLHPLITLMRTWPKVDLDLHNIRFSSDLYYIALKRNVRGAFKYGRNSYDYQEGTLAFIAPGQVATFTPAEEVSGDLGWTILFHPDLIRKSDLGRTI